MVSLVRRKKSGWAELRRKLRLNFRPSFPMSTDRRDGARGESPANSSMGLKYRSHTISSAVYATDPLRP